MSAQIDFLKRCKELGLHNGKLSNWLDEIEALKAENEALKQQVEQGKRDAIPEGFVLVPKEPTSFMKSAMCSVTLDDKEYQFCYDLCWEEATELYKAAIANSPIAAAKKGES